MKTSKYILIIITGIFLLLGTGATAQKRFVLEKPLTTESNTLNYKLAGKQYYNMIVPSGSVFLYNDWQDGYVKLINGDTYENLSLKYNIFLDELIQINNRSVSMIMLDKNIIQEFGFYHTIDGDSMVFIKMNSEKNPKEEHYFQLLHSQNLKLLILHRSVEEETTLYKDKYGYLRNTVFKPRTIYYLVFPRDRFEKFKLKRKSFLNLFPKSRKKEIRRLLRRNRITFQSDEEAVQAVQLVEEMFYSGN